MKRIVLVMLSVFMMSCNIAYEVLDDYYQRDMEGHELYYSTDFEELETFRDVAIYVDTHINYDESKGYQDPKTTFETRLGNCTSYSIAFANILYQVTGEKCSVIFVDHSTRSVVNGGFDGDHAIVELPDGTQIEPQNGQLRQYKVLYKYGFDVIF